jgi:hypothetical protein
MDLTKEFPRSVHDQLYGVVQLPRTIDKGKAAAHGNLGEYHYNCVMDQGVFAFLGIDHEALLKVIKNAKSDAEIEAYVKPFADKKSAQEKATWNADWLANKSEGDLPEYFLELRNAVAPRRNDVRNWPDLLDLDEKRTVPNREKVTA